MRVIVRNGLRREHPHGGLPAPQVFACADRRLPPRDGSRPQDLREPVPEAERACAMRAIAVEG